MRIIPQLDGIRCIAILAVMVFHASYGHFSGGFLGVDLFFVLSGYLITRLLWEEFQVTSTIHLKLFYAKRALRLLPALIVALALAGLLWPNNDLTAWGIASTASLFYFANLVRADMGCLAHTWSLSIEEHFYLLWPGIFGVVMVQRDPPGS
jgi:peptidoglycan/LPS O-acetylase OafA/YrhL